MKTEIRALVPVSKDLVDLDPSELHTTNVYYLMDNIGLKLLHINSKNDYELILAKSLDLDESKKKLNITLKEAVFSNGEPITSQDVARSINRLIARGSAHIPFKDFIDEKCLSKSLEEMSSCIEIIDNKRLVLNLKKPTREILYYFTLADSIVLHESQYKNRKLGVQDWKVISGAYFIENEKLIKNDKALNQMDGSPDVVRLINAPKPGTKEDFLKADMGYSIYIQKSISKGLALPNNYAYAGDGVSDVVTLNLNTKSDKFKSLSTRQWLHSRISRYFLKGIKNNSFFEKANQFFLKGSIAYNSNLNLEHIIKSDDQVPQELKNGIKINTFRSIDSFLFENFAQELSSTLGIPVQIDKTDDYAKYIERNEKRNFDVYLMSTSASYHAVTETLNLLYKSRVRMVDNPNGKVLELIDQYQQFKGNDREVLDQIVVEMAKESEVIPLYYLSSPKFYNSKTVDITDMNPNESMTFWKVRVL